MQHTVTWFDRLRIERVVWALDQRLYDLPRQTRIETRREVRQNLLTGARDVGTTQALRNLGGSTELANEYLSAAFGSRPRHSWTAAALFFVTVPFLALPFLADAANAFASGIIAAHPAATGTYTWGGISHLQSTVTYTFIHGHGTWTGGAFTPLFYILWIGATVLVGRLWRALPAWRRRHAGVA
ncbi:MAG: hypothetical protein ACXVHL_36570 [Solirubrobacteraceae bacterium]